MSARIVSRVLPVVGLLLLASPARAQEEPAPPPPRPAGGTIVVVLPGAPAQSPPRDGYYPAPQPSPDGYYPAPQLPPGGYYPAPQPPPPGAYYPAPQYGYYAPVPQAPPRPRSAFSAKLWAGPSYQRLYDLSLYGVDFGVSLGAQRGGSGWYGEMEGIVGRTDHGLPTYQYWLGPTWEGKIDRVHLGLGVHFGYVGIGRATQGGLMSGLGLGFFGFASVDLYQSDEGHALYLAGRMTANWLDGGNASVAQWGPNVALGWRY